MRAVSLLALMALTGCTALFPETSVAIEKLPVGFFNDASDLLYAVGADIYGWVIWVVDLAL